MQQREEYWAIIDLVGKGGHIRTVPVPDWVKPTIDLWAAAATPDADEYHATTTVAAKALKLCERGRNPNTSRDDESSLLLHFHGDTMPPGISMTYRRGEESKCLKLNT